MSGQPSPTLLSQQGPRGNPRSSVPGTESCCPSSCTIYKYINCRKSFVKGDSPLCSLIKGCMAPWSQWPHRACRQERLGVTLESGWPLGKVWGAEGSMLPGWPDSQSGVRSVAPGAGLGSPSMGRGRPVVRRLRGVSTEVDHPAYSSTPAEQESGPRAGR